MRVPTTDEWKEISDQFWTLYYNNKKTFSVVVLTIAD